eukprot:scaffold3460_cov93-Skeletonema_dohrnii-CCMP3373.AAC.4
MAAKNKEDDNFSGRQSSQGQGGRDGNEQEQGGKGVKPNGGSSHLRSASKSRCERNDLKLYHPHNMSYPCSIPAVHFIQGYNHNSNIPAEYAYTYTYICEGEDEEDESEREYLPPAARRRSEGEVMYMLQQQEQIWQQEQERVTKIEIEEEVAKNDASASSILAGRKRDAKCHCFKCW